MMHAADGVESNEAPCRMEAGAVQAEKVKTIPSLRDFHPARGSRISLSQYEAGIIDGESVA
jgi:glucose-6-phosphate 1-dehydrogenase